MVKKKLAKVQDIPGMQFRDKVGDGEDFPYPIDENGHADIPAETMYIKEEAFLNCSKLISVTIPDSLREIRSLAFEGCPCEEEVKKLPML